MSEEISINHFLKRTLFFANINKHWQLEILRYVRVVIPVLRGAQHTHGDS